MNFAHDRPQDWAWLAQWQPNVIRLMLPGSYSDPASVDVNRIRRVYETCPDATILLRVWDVDDRNFEAHAAMVANPTGEADKQVEWWARLFDRVPGVPRNKLMAGLNNETGPEKDAKLYPYTERALTRATTAGVSLGVFVFSVGRPGLAGESEWDIPRFAQLEPLIAANKGAVVLHEYMQPEGMYAVWTDKEGDERKDYTYLINRHARWPLSPAVPVIIGEWGIDGILYNRHPDPVYGNSGWRNFKELWPPSRYADEYVECIRKASDNVIGICPFISDFADQKWQSFDLIDAYEELLRRKDLCVKEVQVVAKPNKPIETRLPQVGAGPAPAQPPGFVTALSGVNLRAAPNTSSPILDAIPYGEQVHIIGVEQDGWLRVRYGSVEGWVSATYISLTAPEPKPATPQPQPQPPAPAPETPAAPGTLNPLVLEAILQVESGGRGFGGDGRLLIRFEAHVFVSRARNTGQFRYNEQTPWTDQQWRRSPGGPWQTIHTGNQRDEYAAFEFAISLNREAAHQSISMGAPQVMGFNHARIGYPNAVAMFSAFQRSLAAQLVGMVNYILADGALVDAINRKDWPALARGYNGAGNVELAAAKYRAAYEKLREMSR